MRWYRSSRALRSFSLFSGLALFLLGSNYCLVGAIASNGHAVMACHAAAGTEAASSCAAHCGHMTPRAGAPARASHAPTPPCCIALAPVVAPAAGKLVVVGSASVIATLVAMPEITPDLVQWRGHAAAAHSPPRSPSDRAPLSTRAPPLA